MKPLISPYTVGPPIQHSADFFGRRLEQQRFLGMLRQGKLEYWRVEGLRRSGKTSLLLQLKRLVEQRQADGEFDPPAVVAYVDLLKMIDRSQSEFYRLLASEVAAALTRVTGSRIRPGRRAVATAEGFDRWLSNLLRRFPKPYLVVMLDEFGSLVRGDAFDESFFGRLRAWCTADWPPHQTRRLTWVTAARHDDAALDPTSSRCRGLRYLYNVSQKFVLGGLPAEDAAALVREPAARESMALPDDDVNAVCALAGSIPYLLQAVADAWYLDSVLDGPAVSRLERIALELLPSSSQIGEEIDQWWACLTQDQQQLSHSCAAVYERQGLDATRWLDDDANSLVSLGLLQRQSGKLRVASQLFRRWANKRVRQVEPPARTIPLVFICHNGVDDPEAREIADALEQAGLEAFLDSRSIPFTTPWLGKIEEAIAQCDAALVLTGPHGLSPGQHEEINMLACEGMRRRRAHADLPAAQVVLRTCERDPESRPWLEIRQSFDLRSRPVEELPDGLRCLLDL